MNKVSLDPLMIQKALEGFFSKIDDKDGEAQDCIMRITKSVLADPSKYLTLDFVEFLITRFMDGGKHEEADKIMLDPRISVHMYPLDLWGMFIQKLCKEGRHKKALQMIDSLS